VTQAVPPPRPARFSPLAEAFVAASAAGTPLVFIAPPPPPPLPMTEAAALGAALGGLLAPVEGDLEQWLVVVEIGRRALLRLAACDDHRQRGTSDLAPMLEATGADCTAWLAALEAIKPSLELRQKTARAALSQAERTEAVLRTNENWLQRRARLKVMKELQAGQRAAAGMDAGASQAQAAAQASGDAADALARMRAAAPPPLDRAAAQTLQARSKAALVAEDARPAGNADPSLIAARAQALWEATRSEIQTQFDRMRRLLALEGEALRRQALLQQLAVESHGHAVKALTGLGATRRSDKGEADFAWAIAGATEAGRAAGGAGAAYDSAVSSAGYAEALAACAGAIVACLVRIGA